MSSSLAIDCFRENLQLFANPESKPEEFNLYTGLLNLAKTLRGIEDSIRDVQTRISRLEQSSR